MKSTVSFQMRLFVVRLPTSSVLAQVRLATAATAVWLTGGGGGGGVEADDEVTGVLSRGGGSAERGRGVRDDGGSHRPLLLLVDQRDLAVVTVHSEQLLRSLMTHLLQEWFVSLVKLDSEVSLGLPNTWLLHIGNHQFTLPLLLLVLLLVSPEPGHDPGVFSFLEKHLDKVPHFTLTKCSQCRGRLRPLAKWVDSLEGGVTIRSTVDFSHECWTRRGGRKERSRKCHSSSLHWQNFNN